MIALYDLEQKHEDLKRKAIAYLIYAPEKVRKELAAMLDQLNKMYIRLDESGFMKLYFETMKTISDADRNLDISTRDSIYIYNKNQSCLADDMIQLRGVVAELRADHDKMHQIINTLNKTYIKATPSVIDAPTHIIKGGTQEEIILNLLGKSPDLSREDISLETGIEEVKVKKALFRLLRKDLVEKDFDGAVYRYSINK